jgi:hypothetical protein
VVSDGSVGGFAIFSSGHAEGTAALQTQSAYSITLPFDNTSGYVIGAALANLAPTSQNITATIWDDNNNQLGAPQTITINGNGHKAFDVPTLFPVTRGKRGILQLVSSGGISCIGLRFSPFNTFTSIPPTIIAPIPQ